jgi:prepilin-type N-terminal cleavage/methylation domain-containing protein
MKSAQKGFTLIEIAIVLVIIGLLLGGVLKGQELINSAKVKGLANEFRGVSTALYAYQDKYRAIPGDDKFAVDATNGHLATSGSTVINGNGNGAIDGTSATWIGASAPTANNEPSLFWQHVRLAGIATGSSTVGEALNSVGGKLGITSTSPITPPTGIAGTFYVCASEINGKLAKQLDATMDDGVGTAGVMFAAVQSAAGTPTTASGTAAAYADASVYTVCMAI